MKKIGAVLLFSLLITTLYGQAWDGTSIVVPQKSGDIYTITSGSELAWLAQQSQHDSFEGTTFVLSNDIDLGDGHNWQPIGGDGMDFQGVFDGNCHTIKHLNIFYSQRTSDIGLFGAIGTKGELRNLAVESGRIFVSDIENVGCIAGRNEGNINHCFGMIQILANACNNVGGLIGINNGSLTYSYQAGYISDAGNNSGGLTGSNNGTVAHCYVSGYTLSSGANCGSVTGINNGTFDDTYYDQQMCLQKASTKDEDGITSVTETQSMFKIFRTDKQWLTTENWYPQLACFATTSTNASMVSVMPIMLPTSEAPIQRAEALTKNFFFCNDSNIVWTSSDPNVIKVISGGMQGQVIRPCSKRVIIATASKGESRRGVLLQVAGYETFDAGIIGGETRACHGDVIKFSNKTKGAEIKDAVGGRDDDKKQYPYYYKIEQYQVFDHDNDSIFEDTVLFDTYYTTSKDYTKLNCDTEHDGHWVYRRYVHDSQCQLDYVQSTGEFNLIVFSYFDPGDLTSETDTIYGDYPKEVHIESLNDAVGGEGPYLYRWHMSQLTIDYLNNDTTVISDSVQLKDAPDFHEMDTILDQPGEYFFYRTSRDLYCNVEQYIATRGYRHYVVFDSLKAGAIQEITTEICANGDFPTIRERVKPTGGNGIYQYRWLMDGNIITGADQPSLNPNKFDLATMPGATYTFTRQVKDTTGLMDWTQSDGIYTIKIKRPLDPGKLYNDNHSACFLDSLDLAKGLRLYTEGSTYDSTLNYRWLLYNNDADTLIQILDINKPSLSGDSCHLDFHIDSLPQQLKIIRQVYDPECSSDWVNSEGEEIISLGKYKNHYVRYILCEKDLPYQGTYTFEDGETQPFKFTKDNLHFVLTGKTARGCTEYAYIHALIIKKVDIELDSVIDICQDKEYINLPVKNVPDDDSDIYFYITDQNGWRGIDQLHGFINEDNTISLPSFYTKQHHSDIYFQFFKLYSDRDYYYYYGYYYNLYEDSTVYDKSFNAYITTYNMAWDESDLFCQIPDTVRLNINLAGYIHQKWNDVLYIDNNDKNGYPDAYSDLLFSAYQWYKDGEKIDGATGQVYNEQGGLNGVYYAILTDTAGNQYRTCDYEVRPTGLDNAENELSVCPNIISQGQSFTINATTDGNIQIVSLTGKILHSQKHIANIPTNIDIQLPSGLYMICMTTDKGKIYHSHLVVK